MLAVPGRTVQGATIVPHASVGARVPRDCDDPSQRSSDRACRTHSHMHQPHGQPCTAKLSHSGLCGSLSAAAAWNPKARAGGNYSAHSVGARAWRTHCRAIGYRSTAETHLQSTGCDARCAAASPTRARIDSAWLRTERTEPSSPTRLPHRHAWVPHWVAIASKQGLGGACPTGPTGAHARPQRCSVGNLNVREATQAVHTPHRRSCSKAPPSGTASRPELAPYRGMPVQEQQRAPPHAPPSVEQYCLRVAVGAQRLTVTVCRQCQRVRLATARADKPDGSLPSQRQTNKERGGVGLPAAPEELV